MDKLVQPEREICRFGWPAMVASGLGMVIVLALAAWVVDIGVARVAMSGFKELSLGTGLAQRRGASPLVRRFTGETGGGYNTTIAGSDENPGYHPTLTNAQWAVARDHWSSDLQYTIAIAFWKEAERKRLLIDEREKRMGAMTNAEVAQAKTQIERYKQEIGLYQHEALFYLMHAIAKDPANGWYRWTAMEMGALTEAEPTTQEAYVARASGRVPADTCLLVLNAERLRGEKKTDEALGFYGRALVQVNTELRAGIGDDKGKPAGEGYLGDIVDGMQAALKNYSAWEKYVPDDAEVHLRMADYLMDRSEESKRDVARQMDTAGRTAKQDEAAEFAKASVAERVKGITAGEALAANGQAGAELLHLLGLAHMAGKDWEKGMERLQVAVNLRPKRTEWRLELAGLEWDGAKGLAETAKRLKLEAGNPDTPKAKAESNMTDARAMQVRARKIIDSAQETLNGLLDLEPSNKDALELMRTIRDTRGTMFD